ncbi:MAG: tetratricopeptide repeat protein [Elusimicrobiota bacterium]
MPAARAFSLALILAAALPAAGQQAPQPTEDIQNETNRPAGAETTQQQSAQAASAAAKLEAGEADVTYAQVLKDPDNIALNERFANKQVRNGELKGASATLERILMLDPNRPNIRMFYAVVLYRLDNLTEARREFSTLEGQHPPDAVRVEADRYLKLIARRLKNTQLSGRLSVGFESDDNRNASPSSGQMLLGGVPLPLTSGRRSDTSELYMANLEAHRDLGTQAGHELFATFNYYRAEQALEKELNLAAYSFTGGGVYKTPFFDVTPSIVFDHVELAQTTFLRDYGADLRLDSKLSRETDLFYELRDVDQDYSPTDVVSDGNDRSGIQIDNVLGGKHLLAPTNRAGLSLDYTDKHASQHYYAFARYGVTFEDLQLLGRGTFALATLALESDQYAAPEDLLSPINRRDQTARFDLTYGAPLTIVSRTLSDFMATLSYEWYQDHSTVLNYSFTNNKFSAILTYKWNAGF